jgi:hypothetical protein
MKKPTPTLAGLVSRVAVVAAVCTTVSWAARLVTWAGKRPGTV